MENTRTTKVQFSSTYNDVCIIFPSDESNIGFLFSCHVIHDTLLITFSDTSMKLDTQIP